MTIRRRPVSNGLGTTIWFTSILTLLMMVISITDLRAAELKLRQVVLSSAGVGYFEFAGTASGDDEAYLELPLGQVDDALKSLLVSDPNGQPSLRLASRRSLQEIFRNLPFSRKQLRTSASLLNALRGAEIKVTGAKTIEGRVMRTVKEEVILPNQSGTVSRHRASILTKSGLQQFILEDVESIDFLDPALKEQVGRGLLAEAENNKSDSRKMIVSLPGEGERQVRLGYVIPTPLWKISYRLVANSLNHGKARLQGWAVIDNLSGQDWDKVSLSLTSGNPVTYHQALYDAYYTTRPNIPVEVMGRIIPNIDEGAVAANPKNPDKNNRARRAALDRAAGQAEKMMSAVKSGATSMPARTSPAEAPPATTGAVETGEAMAQVNFRFAEPQSLNHGSSAMLAIIDRELPAAALALYQPATNPRHPMAAASIKNDGDATLPPGLVTIYRRNQSGEYGFAGDARLSVVAKGETRMLSYALNRQITIDRSDANRRKIMKGKISRGVLLLTLEDERRTTYRIKSVDKHERDLQLEHRRLPGWKLVAPSADKLEMTAGFYRLPVTLKAGETIRFEAVQRRTRLERVQLVSLKDSRLAAYIQNGQLSGEIRAIFRKIAELRRKVQDGRRAIETIAQNRAGIFEDQVRLRENLARLSPTHKLHTRYVEKMAKQENQLDDMQGREQALRQALDAAEAALSDYVAKVTL